jgi:hypothetical protein
MTEIESCATTVRANSIVPQLTVTVHEIENTYKNSKIGKHKRKTKGKTYQSPRLLLASELKELVGKRCRIFKAKATITGQYQNLQNKDVLIIVVLN